MLKYIALSSIVGLDVSFIAFGGPESSLAFHVYIWLSAVSPIILSAFWDNWILRIIMVSQAYLLRASASGAFKTWEETIMPIEWIICLGLWVRYVLDTKTRAILNSGTVKPRSQDEPRATSSMKMTTMADMVVHDRMMVTAIVYLLLVCAPVPHLGWMTFVRFCICGAIVATIVYRDNMFEVEYSNEWPEPILSTAWILFCPAWALFLALVVESYVLFVSPETSMPWIDAVAESIATGQGKVTAMAASWRKTPARQVPLTTSMNNENIVVDCETFNDNKNTSMINLDSV